MLRLLAGMPVSSTWAGTNQRAVDERPPALENPDGGPGRPLGRRQPVDRGVQDMGGEASPLAGDDHEVELDELASLLLEERADAAPRRERLTDAGAAEVADGAPHVDPRAHRHVAVEGPVGLVEEEAGVDPGAPAAVEPERVVDLLEILGGARLVVSVDRRAKHREAVEAGARGSGPLGGQGRRGVELKVHGHGRTRGQGSADPELTEAPRSASGTPPP